MTLCLRVLADGCGGGGAVCGDHGRCIATPAGGYKCACDPGYTGRHCHESEYQFTMWCASRATVSATAYNATQADHPGPRLFPDINDCKLSPCQNGGTCVDKVNTFQCICKEGWEGETCAISKYIAPVWVGRPARLWCRARWPTSAVAGVCLGMWALASLSLFPLHYRS